MHTLIVISHPDPESFTHAIARAFAEGVEELGQHTIEIADIAAKGFQSAYNQTDRIGYHQPAALPSDVLREQERIDRADAITLVYPIYWWSFPGQLKGWIDRVFTNGWAYGEKADGGLEKLLTRLDVHLIGIGGADSNTYDRHHYDTAMRTQIDHGIFDFCGARVITSQFLLDVNNQTAVSHLAYARELGRNSFSHKGSISTTQAFTADAS